MLSRLSSGDRIAAIGPGASPAPSARAKAAGRDRPVGRVVAGVVAALACAAAGVAIGLALTEAALRRDLGVGSVQIGAWRIAPTIGTPGLNPYQRARLARTGAIPMALGQGVAMTAVRDQSGRKLDRACSYRLEGPIPPARFWTLSLVDRAGFPLQTSAGRAAVDSAEVLRDGEGHATIAISASANPGNWLPLVGTGSFSLVLRLYDTSVTALASRDLRTLPVPAIVREHCP